MLDSAETWYCTDEREREDLEDTESEEVGGECGGRGIEAGSTLTEVGERNGWKCGRAGAYRWGFAAGVAVVIGYMNPGLGDGGADTKVILVIDAALARVGGARMDGSGGLDGENSPLTGACFASPDTLALIFNPVIPDSVSVGEGATGDVDLEAGCERCSDANDAACCNDTLPLRLLDPTSDAATLVRDRCRVSGLPMTDCAVCGRSVRTVARTLG